MGCLLCGSWEKIDRIIKALHCILESTDGVMMVPCCIDLCLLPGAQVLIHSSIPPDLSNSQPSPPPAHSGRLPPPPPRPPIDINPYRLLLQGQTTPPTPPPRLPLQALQAHPLDLRYPQLNPVSPFREIVPTETGSSTGTYTAAAAGPPALLAMPSPPPPPLQPLQQPPTTLALGEHGTSVHIQAGMYLPPSARWVSAAEVLWDFFSHFEWCHQVNGM